MLHVLGDFFPSSLFVCASLPLFFCKLTWLHSVSTTVYVKQKLLLQKFNCHNEFLYFSSQNKLQHCLEFQQQELKKLMFPII